MENKIINEAIERMELLHMSRQCINAFKKGKVWESEGVGALYEVNEEEQKLINEFEKEHKGYKVYHMIHNIYEFGECYSMLYVSTDESEWEQDREDIKDNYIFVYVRNVTYDYYSEFGSVAVKPQIGGLVRIG